MVEVEELKDTHRVMSVVDDYNVAENILSKDGIEELKVRGKVLYDCNQN